MTNMTNGVSQMSTLVRAIKAAWQEMKKPPSYVKGDAFERFIRTTLFPHACYDLLHKNYDYFTSQFFYIESSKEPDFKFRAQKSGAEFFVEAKYRSYFYKSRIEWCKTYQLRRYQVINRQTPTFIVVGVGGQPTMPKQVFLIPMKDIKYTVLFQSFLRKYEIPANCRVCENDLFPVKKEGICTACLNELTCLS